MWSLQKYGVSNSSCSRITFAPLAAASRTSFSARATLASRSQLQAICVAATVTVLIECLCYPIFEFQLPGGVLDPVYPGRQPLKSRRRARADDFAFFAA